MMARNLKFDWLTFNAWLGYQSMAIQVLVEKYPPDRLYYYNAELGEAFVIVTGYQSDLIHEDSVTIHLPRQFNQALKHTLPFDGLEYYGTPVHTLRECDLPLAYLNEANDWTN